MKACLKVWSGGRISRAIRSFLAGEVGKGKGKESVETVEKEGERSELWSAIVEKEERMREGFLSCFPGGK